MYVCVCDSVCSPSVVASKHLVISFRGEPASKSDARWKLYFQVRSPVLLYIHTSRSTHATPHAQIVPKVILDHSNDEVLSYHFSAEAVLNHKTVTGTAWLATTLMANLPLMMSEDKVRTLCLMVEKSVGRLRDQGRWPLAKTK